MQRPGDDKLREAMREAFLASDRPACRSARDGTHRGYPFLNRAISEIRATVVQVADDLRVDVIRR